METPRRSEAARADTFPRRAALASCCLLFAFCVLVLRRLLSVPALFTSNFHIYLLFFTVAFFCSVGATFAASKVGAAPVVCCRLPSRL